MKSKNAKASWISTLFLVISFGLLLSCGRATAQEVPKENFSGQPNPKAGSATLKISLRLPDDSPFNGWASVRVLPTEGYEAIGTAAESDGETVFSDLQAGTYLVEVSAPGFLTVRQNIQIAPGHRVRTLFVIMKTRPLPATLPKIIPSSPAPGAEPNLTSWLPPGVDDVVPPVNPNVECPLPQVLKGAERRMKEFVDNLQKFSATEQVDHFVIDAAGKRLSPEGRNFEYVVSITQTTKGLFQVDEYRNGSVNREQFPAHIATEGLPTMAMIFHPKLANDFTFVCEGFGQWDGEPAWQIHFVQRPDRPNQIRGFTTKDGLHYSLALKGRVWINAGTEQVMHLESELAKPVKEVGLSQEHLSIEYKSVRFQTRGQELWLPQTADLYVERYGRRYYRRHSFSDFKIFMVDTSQSIEAPPQSYSFTNISDHDISGILTVIPAAGFKIQPVSITFTIPAGRSTFKIVGPGKDLNIPVESVGSATFAHNGPPGSVKGEAYLVKETTLDIISDSSVPTSP
jgi:hypothetical protein